MASSKINAVDSLINLSSTIGNNKNIELIKFFSDNKKARASLKFDQESDLEELKKTLEESSLKNIQFNRNDLTLTISFDK